MMIDCGIEREFFRLLNRIVEPRVRRGWGSPRLVPGGVIVLETKGRKSGRRHRVPLAAVRLRGHTLVSTYRGPRSQWVKNAVAHPQVRYWLGGRARSARASVITAAHGFPNGDGLPAAVKFLIPFLVPYTRAGWAFAVLSPDAAEVNGDEPERAVRRHEVNSSKPKSAARRRRRRGSRAPQRP